ncbi:leukocyte elastase inhibitor-like protein, partial [Dinothrombium tinctorium]
MFEALRYSKVFQDSTQVHHYFAQIIKEYSEIDKPFTLCLANRVLVDKNDENRVEHEYKQDLKSYYRASVDEVDFKKESDDIVCICNNWVKDVTKAKVSSIIEKIDSD